MELCIGTADNALRSMGDRPAKISEFTHAVEVSRDSTAGRRVTHHWLGQSCDVEFLDKESAFYNVAEQIPIWVAAGGPRGLAQAAEYADTVVDFLGPETDMIGVIRRELDKAAADAGLMNAHRDELGDATVDASLAAAPQHLGDPHAAEQPHYLDVWAKYLRGLEPA